MKAYEKEQEILVNLIIPWDNIEGWYTVRRNNLAYEIESYTPSHHLSDNQEESSPSTAPRR